MVIGVNNFQQNNAISASVVTEASYVVGAEADRILVAVVSWVFNGIVRTVSGVEFNGAEGFTQSANRSDIDAGVQFASEVWYLLNPTNATGNVVATLSGSADGLSIQLFYLDGAKQQAPEATATAEDLTSPHLVSITTLTNNALIVYGAVFEANGEDITALTPSGLIEDGEVEIDVTFNTFAGMGHEFDVTAGSESGGWTTNGTGGLVAATLVAAAFEEVAGDITGSGTPQAATATISADGDVQVAGGGTPQAATASISADGDVQVKGSGTPQAATAIVVSLGSTLEQRSGSGAVQAATATTVGVAKISIQQTFSQAIFSQESGEAFIILLTIDHPELAAPIRVSSDGVNTISRSNTFISFPFEISLPLEDPERPPRARLQIDNVDQQIVQAVRTITSAPTVLIEIVLSSQPDIVEVTIPDFKLTNASYNALSVTGDLSLEEFLQEPYPADSFTPSRFPGVF